MDPTAEMRKNSGMHHGITLPGLLHAATLIYTSVLAGFMISYVITIGALFSHALRTGRRRELQAVLLPFHKDVPVSTTYAAWVLGQVLVAASSLAANLLLDSGRPLGGQIAAVVAMPLWYTVHVASGFARDEHLAEGGPPDVPEEVVQRFVRRNLPMHTGYAAAYLIAAAWLAVGLV